MEHQASTSSIPRAREALICTFHGGQAPGPSALHVLELEIDSEAIPISKRMVTIGELLTPGWHFDFCDAYTEAAALTSNSPVLMCTCAHLHGILISPENVHTDNKATSRKVVAIGVVVKTILPTPAKAGRQAASPIVVYKGRMVVLDMSQLVDINSGLTVRPIDIVVSASQTRILELFTHPKSTSGAPLGYHLDSPDAINEERAPIDSRVLSLLSRTTIDEVMKIVGLRDWTAVNQVSSQGPCPLRPTCTCKRRHSFSVPLKRDPSGEPVRIDLHGIRVFEEPNLESNAQTRIRDSQEVSTSGR